MTGLLQVVAAAKPREKAGAHTMKRYGFQVHFSILKMLELHKTGTDYRAAFDHFDDLMVFDKADEPEKVDFYQIKSQAKGEWTLSAMTSKDGETKPGYLPRAPSSPHGRLWDYGRASRFCLKFGIPAQARRREKDDRRSHDHQDLRPSFGRNYRPENFGGE